MASTRARSKAYLESKGYIVTAVEQIVRFPDKNKPYDEDQLEAMAGSVFAVLDGLVLDAIKKGLIRGALQKFAAREVMIYKDAFGFGDLLYCGNGEIGLCQTTTKANQSARINKISGLIESHQWLEAGGKICVHGWAKEGKGRKLWTVTVQDLVIDPDFPDELTSIVQADPDQEPTPEPTSDQPALF